MGEIGFGVQTTTSSDYTVGNGDVGTEETGGEKEVNETRRDWKSVLGGPSVTFNGQEKFVSFAMKHPDLLPSANLTPQERNERYESILTKLNRALGGEEGNQSVMFDIYSMMDLIQEMSQKLRNALRDLRKLENTTIYANIRAQAEIQREAAIIGAAAGAVMCAIQIGVVFAGLGTQFKGAKASSATVGKGAMNSAVTQENMLNAMKNPGGNGANALTKDISALRNTLGAKPGPTMQGYEAAKTAQAQSPVAEAEANLNAANTKVNNATAKVNAAQNEVNTAKDRVKLAETKVAEKGVAYSAVSDKGNANALANARTELANAKSALGKAEGALQEAKTELNTAKVNKSAAQAQLDDVKMLHGSEDSNIQVRRYSIDEIKGDRGVAIQARGKELNDAALTKVGEAKQSYMAAKDEYLRAKETVANGGKVPSGKLNELKSNMETARAKYDLARGEQAQITSELKQNNMLSSEEFSKTVDSMSADVEELRGISKQGNAPLNSVDGQKNLMTGMIVSQFGIAVGQFLSQLAGSVREIISSKATELQAEQKLTEEQFDQIRDLFSLVQGVIQKSIDVFASVIQKESSVIEGILQHV